MESKKWEALGAYLNAQIEASAERNVKLLSDHRKDESNFEKIRGNVFDIFKVIYDTALRASQDETQQLQFFTDRLSQIPQSWRNSYQKASEHNDTVKMQQEQVKLTVVNDIETNLKRIYEGVK